MRYNVYSVNGPVVTVKGATDLRMSETVTVGAERLLGEVIRITDDSVVIQVYEDTSGLRFGDPIESTGDRLSCVLGPGLLGSILDGIGRPLNIKGAGPFLKRGEGAPLIDREKKYNVKILLKDGDTVKGGEIFAVCDETMSIEHMAMIPEDVGGVIIHAEPDGEYTAYDTLLKIRATDGEEKDIALCQKRPVRRPSGAKKRLLSDTPLLTQQRIVDVFFPVALGGAACVPGGFGTGKTVLQHQIAKHASADVIIYVGCGERGNEMTQALHEFSSLTDPKTKRPLLERTVLIANTSNMPVAAREASIYTGVTIAEYYRDMGYDAALIADSTSRWAEALREISARLEELPGDEGYPAYLPSRLAEFYERAGRFETLSGKTGSVTLIGAVSPQGADFSEPVTQNTKRFTRVFWALDKSLAYARHFPAINWNESYSEYIPQLKKWYDKNVSQDLLVLRSRMMALLEDEARLIEIAKLVGSSVLPDDAVLTLEISRVIRTGFLAQDALDEFDTATPLKKDLAMMRAILSVYDEMKKALDRSIPISSVKATGAFDDLVSIKHAFKNDETAAIEEFANKIAEKIRAIE